MGDVPECLEVCWWIDFFDGEEVTHGVVVEVI